MSGINLRVKKLFKDKKNLVISAIDHVLEYGDQEGIEDSRKAILNCMGTDALLLSRFSLKRNWDLFGAAGSPMPVMRVNWTSAFYYPLNYKKGFTEIACDVEEAVQAGAEIIICSLFLENGNEEMEARNISIFSEVVRQKEKLGIPLIGECYVVEHQDLTAKELHDKVKRVTRVMSELGADIIKAFYTEDFNAIAANNPVPVFTIGAEKLKNDLAVLDKAKNSVENGARGIIFGRNIFMAKDPKNLIKALDDVMNNGAGSTEALKKYGLE